MFKIPKEVVMNFISSEFEVKKTTTEEIRIKSIYTTDPKFKCYIDPEKFQFCDFKSGVSGSCYTLFKDYLGVNTNKEVIKYIMKNYGFGTQLELEKIEELDAVKVTDAIKDFNSFEHPIYFYQKDKIGKYGKECLKYLMSRKINIDYIRNMGYVSNPSSTFSKRIIIPYIENGRMVYFQARSTNKDEELRYLNPVGLDTKEFVFNYDKLNDDELIICEGPFDAMSMDEQVATCMCSGDLSSKQLKKIFSKAKPKTIIYVPDQDETGLKKMENNIKNIYTYADYTPNVLIYNIGDGCKDLNELKIKTGKNYILKKECIPYKKTRRKFSFEE